ncbi:50S ribosomal protein L18 [Helicobacter cetorum]|uniref:Large ribosomal subunit protein uL18 n=1 Tax=Helicobacter cetorum (strain ATCC BAA-429 / MIT 00-7128) TaxID=182217 RepID=I0EKF7_HELC0|nr:50S ribosomal protein L18 [Helicobacter cetorum]AFI03426.1 50S ribosomal protein L18 [Helicobacter cetorum MIT 00-7128]
MNAKALYKKKALRERRKLRIKSKLFGDALRPRVSVFRSNRYFYAQAIDDVKQHTLAHIDGRKLGLKNTQEDAKKLGALFAEQLKKAGVEQVVYDRNGYLYHGVVATFAETLRENGIVL